MQFHEFFLNFSDDDGEENNDEQMFSEKDSSMMLQSKWSDSEGDEDWINLLNTNRLNIFLNSFINHLSGIYYHKIGISKIYKKGAKIIIHMIWKQNLTVDYSEFWIHLMCLIIRPFPSRQ